MAHSILLGGTSHFDRSHRLGVPQALTANAQAARGGLWLAHVRVDMTAGFP